MKNPFEQKNAIRHIAVISAFAIMTGCGGGGSNGSDDAQKPSVTYTSQGGLKWASTTASTYTWDEANSYCTKQTCSGTDMYGAPTNCTATNFNSELGWRLPTYAELQSLYNVTPTPQGWFVGPTWSSSRGLALNFSTGGGYSAGDSVTLHTTCVKPI